MHPKSDLYNEIHTYLSIWRDDERFTDLNLMLDKGLTNLAAYTLVYAEAINSSICYEDAASTERLIEELILNYTEKQKSVDYSEFWKNTKCWVNNDNEHYFINSEIHFVDDDELREWGFKPSDEK